ncbi:carbamoyltransferase [candidate division KSB1 bacterium]|nr:carbamoyltransferase [candidate division KSB1 bacterium]
MIVLGISCFFHDAAACLIRDGRIVAAASEERFTRKKHDAEFPVHAIRFCLEHEKILIDDVDVVAFYDKPFRKFDRILTMYLATFPKSRKAFVQAIPSWVKRKLFIRQLIEQEIHFDGPIIFGEHHLSHAASAFLVSPFDKAAILTIDGVGEWDTASIGVGEGKQIRLLKELRFPHSLGLLYNAFTYYLGFKVNSDEYKVMGLAPYGDPVYADRIRSNLIDLREDGSFAVDLSYFSYHYGLRMTNRKFDKLFGIPPRKPESALEQKHKDLAASIQKVTEEILVTMARHLHRETGLTDLCLAGGVALNCVANGRILRETPFKRVFIQPASGDAGGALGVASFCTHSLLGIERSESLQQVYLGPDFSDRDIQIFLGNEELFFEVFSQEVLLQRIAAALAQGKIVGWFQGRMEFGPRALGNRSILADPRVVDMKDRVNRVIKFREDFRPFAPAVLAERAADFFELDVPSPYMLLVAQVRADKRDLLPAITHVDGSARIQTVDQETNPLFYDLLKAFDRQTDCPVLLNTSFNVRGEPIVCTPREAVACFKKTEMDILILGNAVLTKS